MKRKRILTVLLCILLLAGCGKTDNPYRVDTVVRIPVDPTAGSVATESTEPAETEAPTEEATEATEATEPKKSSSGKKSSSSGKKPASSNKKPASDKKQETTKQTEPEQESTSVIIGALKETLPKATELEPTGTETVPATEVVEFIPPTEAVETVPPTEPPFAPSDYSPGSLDYAILEELNAQRAAAGLEELTVSKKLCGIAALRAREAAELWSHTRPDGRDYTSAMTDYGYSFGTSAENLAAVSGSGDAQAVVNKWMNSDSSKILGAGFTAAGVGVYRSGGVTYVVSLLVG